MIYKATIRFDMFIEAPNEYEAREIVEEDAEDELDNAVLSPDFDCEIEEITDISQVPHEFRQTLPWGGDGETDIETLLKS